MKETLDISSEYSAIKGIVKMSFFIAAQLLYGYTFYEYFDVKHWKQLLLATYIGIALSDFVAGFVHWALDNFR